MSQMPKIPICSMIFLYIFMGSPCGRNVFAEPEYVNNSDQIVFENFELVGQLTKEIFPTFAAAYCMAPQGGFMYAAGDESYNRYYLYVFDCLEPSSPKLRGRAKIGLYYIYDMAVLGNYVYVVGSWPVPTGTAFFDESLRLEIFDVSDPDNPESLPAYELDDSWGPGVKIWIGRDKAYISSNHYNNNNFVLLSINVSDPRNPYAQDLYEGVGYVEDLAFNSNWAFYLSQGLGVLNTLDEQSPLSKFIPIDGSPLRSIDLVGNRLYIGENEETEGRLSAYDVSNPSESSLIFDSRIGPTLFEIASDNGRICSSHSANNTILRLSDFTDPLNPMQLASAYVKSGNINGNDFLVRTDKDLIYICHGSYDYNDYAGYIHILRYTPPAGVKITQLNQFDSLVTNLRPQKRIYTDRTYQFIDPIPGHLLEQSYIQTLNSDKNSTNSELLRFTIDRETKVYIAYDERYKTVPSWLSGWEKTGERLTTTDQRGVSRMLYAKNFPAGQVTLGGNRDEGMPTGYSMYSVILESRKNGLEEWSKYE